MKKLRAFKFKLKANSNQQTMMARFAGCGRYVYNKALAEQKERLDRKEGVSNYATLCRSLTEWRHANGTAFLAEAPTHPLQQSLKDLGRAFSNFFSGRARFPRFKKKSRGDSFRYPDPKQIKLDEKNSRIDSPLSPKSPNAGT
jgi:putative transposase